MQTKRNKEFCLMKKKLKFTEKHEKTNSIIAAMFVAVIIIAWCVIVDHSCTSIKANAPGSEELITTTVTSDISITSTTGVTSTSTSVTTTTTHEQSTTSTKTATTSVTTSATTSETTNTTAASTSGITTVTTTSSLFADTPQVTSDEYLLVALTFDEEVDIFVEEYVVEEITTTYIEEHFEEMTTVTETYIEEHFEETTTNTKTYIEEFVEETTTTEYCDEEAEDEYEYTQLPITEDERILLCNLVGREYGQDYIPTYEKAKVVAVVMNRVRAGSAAGFADTIYGVLTQPYQFSGYYVSYEYTWQVTDDVIAAVDYYFTYPEEFSNDIYYFYGDGYYNYFY